MSAGAGAWVGIDAGGSKTLAVVVDQDGHELGRARAGGANYQAVGLKIALAAMQTALESALRVAGRSGRPTAVWMGMAGIDRPADHALWLPHLAALTGAPRLTNDAELALAALEGAVGVAVIAGTGAIALGRDAGGRTARASGWGHLIGDEGSGYDIGRACLRAVARAADGRGPLTALVERVAAEWALDAPDAMIGRVYPVVEKAEIARLAPLVSAAASEGDAVARGILARAAGELALAAVAVGRMLALPPALPLALGGGLLVHNTAYREQVTRRIGRCRALGQVTVVADPALAAARAAARLWSSDWWTA
jgi:N-acetylglucosamine kinase-like BadF-type ATPase